jgi:hypothetical protein
VQVPCVEGSRIERENEIEFELTGARQGVSQVVVHGTAVIIKPIVNYVPTGAVGNILAEIEEKIEGS